MHHWYQSAKYDYFYLKEYKIFMLTDHLNKTVYFFLNLN